MGNFSSFASYPIDTINSEEIDSYEACFNQLKERGVIRDYCAHDFNGLTIFAGFAKCYAWDLGVTFDQKGLKVCVMDQEGNSYSTFENIN